MELTKEYFDEALKGLETRLIAHADEKQAELARMIERTINVTVRVERLEHDIQDIKRSLKLA